MPPTDYGDERHEAEDDRGRDDGHEVDLVVRAEAASLVARGREERRVALEKDDIIAIVILYICVCACECKCSTL